MTRHRWIAVVGMFVLAASSLRPAHAAAYHKELGPELFITIRHRDPAALKSLLAKGADPNTRNFLGFTPLMFAAAAGSPPMLQTLLQGGAELDAKSLFGSPLTFAAMGGNPGNVRFLTGKGANLHPDRGDKMTPLMIASSQGYTEVVRLLLARKPEVNALDTDGVTALMGAARSGHVEIVKLLLGHGANVNEKDSHGWTALSYASMNGQTEAARFLLRGGSNANVVDEKGLTPLALAFKYGREPALVRLLSASGAKVAVRTVSADAVDKSGVSVKPTQSFQLVSQVPMTLNVTDDPASSRTATVRGLAILQSGMGTFSKRVGCVSCHHQGLGLMATGEAKDRGFPVKDTLAKAEMKKVYDQMVVGFKPMVKAALAHPETMSQIPSMEINEFNVGMAYPLTGLAYQRQPSDESLAATVRLLAKQQLPEGNWDFTLPRIPMQSSFFTVTALAVRLMKAYETKGDEADAATRIAKAAEWMKTAPARTTEDMTFRLLGLKWAGASSAELQGPVADLLKGQRPDGGWAQEPSMKSDAYATGEALYALTQAGGITTYDPSYRKGKRFLLETQDGGRSWVVHTCSLPANIYTDAGFPHGESQFTSFTATCWATMALLQEYRKAGGKDLVTER